MWVSDGGIKKGIEKEKKKEKKKEKRKEREDMGKGRDVNMDGKKGKERKEKKGKVREGKKEERRIVNWEGGREENGGDDYVVNKDWCQNSYAV